MTFEFNEKAANTLTNFRPPVHQFAHMGNQGVSPHAPLAMLGIGAAMIGGAAINGMMNSRAIAQSYQTMLKRYPELQRENPNRVKQLYDSIANAAPDVAKDPTVTGSLVKRMLNYDGIDHATYLELVRAQESMTKTRMSQLTPFTSLVDPAVKLTQGMFF